MRRLAGRLGALLGGAGQPAQLRYELLERAQRAGHGRRRQDIVIEALQEYVRHHGTEHDHTAAIEDDLALLTSGELDHPNRNTAWH